MEELSALCPAYIGREDTLTAMYRLTEETLRGTGQVVLASGEAGVGKSRLVTETIRFAEQHGFLHLQGNCFQTDASFPFAPFLDLLHSYILSSTPEMIVARWKTIAPELLRLSPEFAWYVPAFAAIAPLSVSDPQQEKHALFAAITYFFSTLAKQQPLLLVIEDIHWSDDSSLELLLHLARQRVGLPVLLILTFRSEEISSNLQQSLAEFDREHLAHEVLLTRLSRTQVDAMLQAIFDQHSALHTGLLESMYTLTDGNPFFVEEIIKSLIVTGEITAKNGVWERTTLLGTYQRRPPIPRSVQIAVQQRFERLTPEAKQVLTLAAVAGRRFDFSLLGEILGLDEAHLLTLIRELMAAQFVVEESEERFSFRHALTRQAIYTTLLLRERKALHRTLGETIERHYASPVARDGHTVDLAYHFYEAGVWEKALEYGQLAGEKSVALYAPRAAIEHFSRALQAQSHLAEAPSVTLYRARGNAYETLGAFERARSDYEQALHIAQELDDSTMQWQSLLDLGFLWAGRDYGLAGQWFRQALDLAQRSADPRLQAHSLNRLGNWLVNTGKAEQGLASHHEALKMFEQLHDMQGMAETLDLLGMGSGIYGDTVSAVSYIQEAIPLLRASQDNQQLTISLTSLVAYTGPSWVETTYSVAASLDDCMLHANEALSIAQKTDTLHAQAYAQWMTGGTLSTYGELGAGLRYAQESLRIATEIGHGQWQTGAYFTIGRTYLLMLESALAVETLKKGLVLSSELGSAWWTGTMTAYFAMACILKGTLARAEAALRKVMLRDAVPQNSPERRMLWAWGELALARKEPGVALEIAEHLLASAPGSTKTQPIPWLLQLKAKALIALGHIHEATEVLEAAKRGALERQERSLLWQLHGLLGQLYKRTKQEEQARREIVDALKVVDTLKNSIDDDYLREHFLRMAVKVLPKERYAASGLLEKYRGISEREYTVATLVAEGRSNREIAEQLIVSERTIETHVSHILAKLGFSSRKQIAEWRLQNDNEEG